MSERIVDIFENPLPSYSIEVFPPKPNLEKTLEIIFDTIDRLKVIEPSFVSVTYGSGGYNRERALSIAGHLIQGAYRALSHITAVGYLRSDIVDLLDQLYYLGVRNVLALRGDIPPNLIFPDTELDRFRYAYDLIDFVKRDGRFCIGAAAYPEGYADSGDVDLSVLYLKKKAEVGADFFITQLFFDNARFYRFLEKARAVGISQPIVPAIMPILRNTNLKRILSLSSTSLPSGLQEKIDRFGADPLDLEKVGIAHAAKQVQDLREHGMKHIHLYTMNKSKQIIEICRLSETVSKSEGR